MKDKNINNLSIIIDDKDKVNRDKSSFFTDNGYLNLLLSLYSLRINLLNEHINILEKILENKELDEDNILIEKIRDENKLIYTLQQEIKKEIEDAIIY